VNELLPKAQLNCQLLVISPDFVFQKLSFCYRKLGQEWFRLCSLQCQTHYHGFWLYFTRLLLTLTHPFGCK